MDVHGLAWEQSSPCSKAGVVEKEVETPKDGDEEEEVAHSALVEGPVESGAEARDEAGPPAHRRSQAEPRGVQEVERVHAAAAAEVVREEGRTDEKPAGGSHDHGESPTVEIVEVGATSLGKEDET